jgi:transposase
MDTARDALPDDITALKEALATERAKALEVAAELAVARAKASEDSALIAQQKLRIAKLERQIYGQRSERSSRLIDQLALTSEELEPAPPKTSLRPREPSPGRQLCADLRARAPNATRSPIIFPESAW